MLQAAEIRALLRELFDGAHDPPLDDRSIAAVMAQPDYKLFTVQRDGRTVAMVSLYTVRLFSRHLAVIEEVVTLNEYRNQGIGSALVKEALQEAKRRGADCIELTVREDRPETQHFYESLGFRDRRQRAMRLCVAK